MQDLFQPVELQAMVVGNENYDWEELEKVSAVVNSVYCIQLGLVKVSCCRHEFVDNDGDVIYCISDFSCTS